MALTVETGVNVEGADSYVSPSDLTNRAIALGYGDFVCSLDSDTLNGYARRATIYLDHAWRWKGRRANVGQARQWPRVGVKDRDGQDIADDVIPVEIIDAQVILTAAQEHGPLEGSSGGASGSGRTIVAERTDDASVQYERGSATRQFPLLSAMLRHLVDGSMLGSFRQVDVQRG